MERPVGMLLIAAGVGLVAVGVLAITGGLSWFGRLPGDLRFEGDSSRVYLPITSMLVVSVALTLLVNLVGRWWR
jgi:hypothetical protein